MVHSSATTHSYRNNAKVLNHKSFDCLNDNQEEGAQKYSETESLLPKNETNAIIIDSKIQR